MKLATRYLKLLILLASLPIGLAAATPDVDDYLKNEKPPLLKGFYVGTEVGAMIFTGSARSNFSDGPLFGLKVGYDLLSWIAVELAGRMTLHDNNFVGAAAANEPSYFLYMVDGKVKFAGHLTRRLSMNLFGGGGVFTTNPPFEASSRRNRTYVLAGAGIEYYLHIKHLAVALNPGWMLIQDLSGSGVMLSGSVKYTF